MKYLIAILFAASLFACKKSVNNEPPKTQKEIEMLEPLKDNQIISDGAVRIKLDYQNATIMLSGEYLEATQPGVNYFIEDLPDNSETMIYAEYVGSGIFNVMAEGFTASTNTKRFYLNNLAIGSGKKPFMKVHKGIVRYTFTIQ